MALTIEWRNRIDNWRNELLRLLYRPLGEIRWEGFITKEQLSAQEAATRTFQPMPPGTRWGAKWEYGWFKTQISLPQEAAGKRIVLKADVGGESAVYING
ncbi:MAG: hypothetical protein J7M05_04660, partial [Anaerolineae bacterium]|nr:hypothetical protein [Anaerolineae bacterium]